MTVWRLRAWDDESIQRAWLDRSIVAISEDRVGEMDPSMSRDEVKVRLRAAYPAVSERTISVWAGYWVAFLAIQAADIVVVPLTGGEVAVAEVRSPYEYVAAESNARLRHRYAVRWLGVGIPRAALDDDIRRTVSSMGTICRIKAPGAAARLRRAASGGGDLPN